MQRSTWPPSIARVGGRSILDQTGTEATYFNNASFDAADPYVLGKGATRLTLTYRREKASGAYEDVYDIVTASDGAQHHVPVSVTVKLG